MVKQNLLSEASSLLRRKKYLKDVYNFEDLLQSINKEDFVLCRFIIEYLYSVKLVTPNKIKTNLFELKNSNTEIRYSSVLLFVYQNIDFSSKYNDIINIKEISFTHGEILERAKNVDKQLELPKYLKNVRPR